MLTESYVSRIFFVFSIIFFFYALMQLLNRAKHTVHFLKSLLFFSIGYEYLFSWLDLTGIYKTSLCFLNYTDSSFIFLIGPVMYFYFLSITGNKNVRPGNILLHEIPFLISFIVTVLINIYQPDTFHFETDSSLFYLNETKDYALSFLIVVPYFSLFLYLILALRKIYYFFGIKMKSREIQTILFFLAFSILATPFMLLGHIIGSDLLIYSGMVFFSMVIFLFVIFSIRYPEYTVQVIRESRKLSYKHNIEAGVKDSIVADRLVELMETEKLFQDESLSLKKLSEHLMVTHHELSRIINDVFKLNFYNLVNSYRIKEAHKIFMEKPDKAIIEVVFETGFSTKACFYSNFVKFTGISPGEFRKNCSIL